jgi:type I restriction enzyme S subunit
MATALQTGKLGELVTFKTGKLDSNAAIPDGDYPFFTCSQETLRTNTYSFDTECVLLAGNNANGIFPLKYFKGKFDAYQRTYIVRPRDANLLTTKFLYYALRLKLSEFRSFSTGAATKFLTLTILNETEIQAPPLPVQQRIAGILSAYDELIENSQRRIKILESMARALYREWFVHFRFPGFEHHPRVASPLGEIPQGWEVKRLVEVCRSIQDGDWIETKDQGGEDFRLLQISNIGVGEFIETGNFRYVTRETFDRLRCSEIIPGDLLVARMPTPIGRGWLATKMAWRMITAVDVAIVRAEPTAVDPLFLVQAWNESSNLQRIAAQASGTTRLRITRRELAAMEFVVPPIPVQQQFAAIVQPQSAMIETLRQQIQNLRRTRDLLLPRLLSGQIDMEKFEDA